MSILITLAAKLHKIIDIQKLLDKKLQKKALTALFVTAVNAFL